ncbi:MAG: UvrD-helicase domain-containing protein [Desulfobacteraceae bacterium]|nr:UvrD-helicase domain-containing protein [Desulfobacteraceae bacterium]
MKFIADLHVHSKYSRATAKNLDLENLYIAAQLKGIRVVGTGDFTHPEWFSELSEKLEPVENERGLFALKPAIASRCDEKVPLLCRAPVRFMLVSEISNIYKKNDRTRKNHNLVFMPDLARARQFNARLDQIGNISSDGRPILGLDARNLLEIVLETSARGYLIPAHIWTPWFSVLGSKSGYDAITDCFEDLSPHIFAVETGLSSDPAMNWRVSSLDRYTLVSNSDAHSPMKLGREANLFDCELSFDAIRSTLETGDTHRFKGTFEFYPDQGKYHADGHRKCGICLWPVETMKHKGICPVCGKALTLGVLYRVEELADRKPGIKPDRHHPFYNLIPLDDILSEIYQVGAGSKKVKTVWQKLVEKLGPEFRILHELDKETIDAAGIALLGEAIVKMRKNSVNFSPGFDGEFGKVSIFSSGEREQILGQQSLFSSFDRKQINDPPFQPVAESRADSGDTRAQRSSVDDGKPDHMSRSTEFPRIQLNEQQQAAVEHGDGPLIIVAGPGTGKTRTITHRMAHLICTKKTSPRNILALTFTNKAASELRNRLSALLDDADQLPLAVTFHALCLEVLNDQAPDNPISVADDSVRRDIVADALELTFGGPKSTPYKPGRALDMLVAAKQAIVGPGDDNLSVVTNGRDTADFSRFYHSYQRLMAIQGYCDFEDLIFNMVLRLESDLVLQKACRDKWSYIFVDEYQDLNQGQYRILKALCPPDKNLCVIGDPDQSIYGFRGSDLGFFRKFREDFPGARVIELHRNYRSTEAILESSHQIIQNHKILLDETTGVRTYSRINGDPVINILELASEKAEAVAIGKIIERSVGGTGFYAVDFGKVETTQTFQRAFSDFAVLYRTHQQGRVISEALEKAGIPCRIAGKDHLMGQKGIAELISLAAVVSGTGSFSDFRRIAVLFKPSPGNKDLDTIVHWAYAKSLSLHTALAKAARIPVPGLSLSRQQRLFDMIRNLSQLVQDISDLKPVDTLAHLVENTALAAVFNQPNASTIALDRLKEMAAKTNSPMPNFLSGLCLAGDTDIYNPNAQFVTLMTMHASKGLEFQVVFIAGCENDFIPYRHSPGEMVDRDEERRLFYVAMTRAQHNLYLTMAKKRHIFGKTVERTLSDFVRDIETHLRDHLDHLARPKKKTQKQLPLF